MENEKEVYFIFEKRRTDVEFIKDKKLRLNSTVIIKNQILHAFFLSAKKRSDCSEFLSHNFVSGLITFMNIFQKYIHKH